MAEWDGGVSGGRERWVELDGRELRSGDICLE